MTFTKDELNLMREWYDAVSDLAPLYLEDRDRALAAKIKKALADDEQQVRDAQEK